MSITYHERPGVYVEYDTTGRTAAGKRRVAGIAALSTGSGAYRFTTVQSALAVFPASTTAGKMLALAFQNGAATVAFVPVAGAQGYEAAFERLLTTCEADVIATDCSDADALSALGAALCTQGTRECVAFAGLSDPSLAELRNLAEALNCERLGLLGPDVRYAGETSFGGGCLAAAAMAGLVCAQDDPALPLSGAALQGLDAVSTALVESEIDTLVHAGVIPLEQVGGQVRIIRAVTTRTATEGMADATWRELSTVMIVDDVIPAVRDALSAKFLRRKNTAVTRNAIRAQTAIILDDRVRRQIIEEYDSLTVEPVEGDPTACAVSFSFGIVQGLLRIHLYAHILV